MDLKLRELGDETKVSSPSNLQRTVVDISSSHDNLDVETQEATDVHIEIIGKGDPFGREDNADVKYKTMRWWHCGFLMIGESVSLGILSLPSSMATLGLVPGIVLIVGFGLLTTYTGYVLGQFKLRYPQVHSMADAGEILFGSYGREIITAAQVIFFIFLMGAHVLTFSIMMNTLTNHARCTVIFCFVGAAISFIFSLPRTLHKVSYLAIFATMVTMIAVGVEARDPHAYAIVNSPLISAFSSTLNIIVSLSGHIAFFSFQSELADPREYPKALLLLQGTDTLLYLIVAVVIYRYSGAEVQSPAFLSASLVVRKVAFGLASGTIVIAGVILGHVGAKCIYVRIFRGTSRMNERSAVSVGTWVLITFAMWTIAWVIAEAIPVFNDLLGLLAAAFCSWFTFGLEGLFWLHLNKGRLFSSPIKSALTVLNIIIIGVCLVTCGMGLWAVGTGIAIDVKHTRGSFSCANNAA